MSEIPHFSQTDVFEQKDKRKTITRKLSECHATFLVFFSAKTLILHTPPLFFDGFAPPLDPKIHLKSYQNRPGKAIKF